jgi:hypothetical protein
LQRAALALAFVSRKGASMATATRRELSQNTRVIGGISLAAVALGAVAFGALAIGFLAINRLAVKQARIKRLEIGELVVGRVRRLPPASRGPNHAANIETAIL